MKRKANSRTKPRTKSPAKSNGLHPGGRPSAYSPELVELAWKYVDGAYLELAPIPTVKKLAKYLGVSRETIYTWRNDPTKPEFAEVVSELMAEQEDAYLIGGLTRQLDSGMCRLALAKHGYSQAVSAEVSGREAKPLKLDHGISRSMSSEEALRLYLEFIK